MLAEIFYWLFNMSIAASVTGCVLLLLRRIRWIPRRVTAALWAIPFLRMWIKEEGYEQAFFLEAVKTTCRYTRPIIVVFTTDSAKAIRAK